MAPRPDPARLGVQFTPTVHNDTYAEIDPVRNSGSWAGKSVLVTGAAKGIGQAIAVSYAAAGASRIAITARGDASATRTRVLQAAAEAGSAGLELVVLKLDVCDNATIEACAAEVTAKWGYIDVLVNNAGYLAPFEPLAVSDKAEWWRTWEVNVRGVYWVARAFMPLLLQSTEKTMVNVTSVGALALTPGASAYQPSKMAVMRLTEYLMMDYADQGLLAYSVHPASVPTDLASRMPEAVVKAVCNDTPELAGDTIVFLTSQRREWLAGRYISCAWDMPQFLAKKQDIVDHDLLKLQVTFSTEPPSSPPRARGRVSRINY